MKTVVITGATSGIGLAAARRFAAEGYAILGVGRDAGRCEAAVRDLHQAFPNIFVDYFCADLVQQQEVHRVADELMVWLNQHANGKLDVLINNAGCVRSWYTTSQEGYEQQFALNHLAGFLLAHLLLPSLSQAHGCILFTGSRSHRQMRMRWDDVMFQRHYHPLLAYKQSKLCNALCAYGINARLSAHGIRAYVVDPGLVKTDIGNKQTGGLVHWVWGMRKRGGTEPSVPAEIYWMLVKNRERCGGLYYKHDKQDRLSKQVDDHNAARLMDLSEQLCGITFGEGVSA